MSRGIRKNDDPLQYALELEEYRARLHYEELPRAASPDLEEQVHPIIDDGLEYPTVPTKYEYPAGFDVGVGPRVVMLNRTLLQFYGLLGKRINKHARAVAILKHNQSRPELKKSQLEELQANVHFARSNINGMIYQVLLLLGEVDAVGGSEAHYVPDQLHQELGMPRASYIVGSGSLARLAEPPYYVLEERPVPSNIHVGDDTAQGRANQELRDRFQELAFNTNRIQYLVESGFKDFYLTTQQQKLRRLFEELDLNMGEGYLTMPTDLHEAIVKMLSAADKEKEEHKQKVAEAMKKKEVEEMLYQQESQQRQMRKRQDQEKENKPTKSSQMAGARW